MSYRWRVENLLDSVPIACQVGARYSSHFLILILNLNFTSTFTFTFRPGAPTSIVDKMPVTEFDVKEKYRYQNGFDSYFE